MVRKRLIAEDECVAVLLVDHLYGATDVVRNSFQYLAALHRLGDESVAGRREFPRSDLKGLQCPWPVVLCPLVGIERTTDLVQKLRLAPHRRAVSSVLGLL